MSAYQISKYEVTNLQYAEFLNAVAATDTNGLYNESMESDARFGGITRSGSSGTFTYTVKAGFESKPVVYVSWYDSLRFANWLNNGQGNASTEDGAYTITATGISTNSIERAPGALIFLPSEDEWYKAAYYDTVAMSFFDYPTGTNAVTDCVLPGSDTGNSANCWPATAPQGALTDVGAYGLSASPNGTYDQGGNVYEWNESIPAGSASPPGTPLRGERGGSWNFDATYVATSNLNDGGYPTDEDRFIGFRVAAVVPEPSSGLLLMAGVLGLAGWRRKRHRVAVAYGRQDSRPGLGDYARPTSRTSPLSLLDKAPPIASSTLDPLYEGPDVGFRVVPEPATPWPLLLMALVGLARLRRTRERRAARYTMSRVGHCRTESEH